MIHRLLDWRLAGTAVLVMTPKPGGAGQRQAGIAEVGVVEEVVEVEGEVERFMLGEGDALAQRAIEIPEREATQRVAVAIHIGAELHIAKIVVNGLGVGEQVQAGAAGSGVARGADPAGSGDILVQARAQRGRRPRTRE